MPRFPTILVIGSQDMSTTFPASGCTRSLTAISVSPPRVGHLVAPARRVAGGQLWPVVPPLRFLVDGLVRDPAELPDHGAVEPLDRGGQTATRRRIHERHELVGEARHRAADADPAHVGTAADAGHPAALRHIAVHDRPPAADLHLALGRVVVLGEVPLLVVAGPVAALVDRLAEDPLRP